MGEPDGEAVAATPDDRDLHGVLASVLDATTDLVGIADGDGRVVYLNLAARAFLGLGADAPLVGITPFHFLAPEAHETYAAQVLADLGTGHLWEGEVALRRHDGVDVPHSQVVIVHRGDDGRILHVSSVARDLSERIRLTEQLTHQATHDPLTGLANRRLFLGRLEQALARVERHGDDVAVLFLDLDRFKSINDRLGHGAGDELLVELAERLRSVFRTEDVIGRLGGDEYVVLCQELPADGDVAALGHRVVDAVARPYELAAGEAVIEVSVGVVTAGPGAGTADRVLRTADTAMYRAKARGRNEVELIRLPPGY